AGTEIKKAFTILIIGDRVWPKCMDHVRELHGISDKEYFYIVSYQVPVSVFCIKFNGKSSRVANGFRRMIPVNYSRKSNKNRRLFSFFLKDLGTGIFGNL